MPEGDLEQVDKVPSDICCLLDVSGSMCSAAKYENSDGVECEDGFSALDIVKHAINSVMHMCAEYDRVSLVVFSDNAEVVFPLTKMTEQGRIKCHNLLAGQKPGGRTNLWDGILAAMETLRTDTSEAGVRRKVIMLLTDGEPTIEPPHGYVPELKNYMDQYPKFKF
jgi:Mg-chelatase subunit ChlD